MRHFDDETAVAKDGETIKVNMLLMDSVEREIAVALGVASLDGHHQPGFVGTASDDAARHKLYADADAALSRRYLDTQMSAIAPAMPSPVRTASAAYRKYEAWLTEAWKGGAA